MNAVSPRAAPGSPDVRAKTTSCVAWCIPELKRLAPLMTQSSPSRTAVVSSHVASTAVVGLGQPERDPRLARMIGSAHRALLVGSRTRAGSGRTARLPTIDASFWRSLCSPSPLAARCSRMTAMSRFVPSRPPMRRRQGVAEEARRVGAAAHLAQQLLPVRATGRRRSRGRCARTRGGGRRTACCRRPLERGDLALDERVELGEQSWRSWGSVVVHRSVTCRRRGRASGG